MEILRVLNVAAFFPLFASTVNDTKKGHSKSYHTGRLQFSSISKKFLKFKISVFLLGNICLLLVKKGGITQLNGVKTNILKLT